MNVSMARGRFKDHFSGHLAARFLGFLQHEMRGPSLAEPVSGGARPAGFEV
jgi:hypothetical protein